MQNTFSQSGNDSKWFSKKSFFIIGMWNWTPPHFMEKTILNFHFDCLNPSLINLQTVTTSLTMPRCHLQNSGATKVYVIIEINKTQLSTLHISAFFHIWGDLLRSVRHIKNEVKLNFQETCKSNSIK